jgi:cobalt-zinc-cadmium efflux system outer membrane protein
MLRSSHLLTSLLLAAAAAWAARSLRADEARPLDPPPAAHRGEMFQLEDLQALAEANSPVLAEAAAAIAEARGRALQAGLYPNPTLGGGTQQLGGSDSQYLATVNQSIVTKGKLRLDRAAICREVSQAQLRYVRARFDLVTVVRQRFYTLLAAQARVTALEELVGISTKSRESAQLLLKSGEGTKVDSLLLEIELERAEVGLENARTQLAALRRQFAAQIGMPDLVVGEVDGKLAAALPDYEAELVARGYLSQNALAQIARVEVERARIVLQRAVVEPAPNVGVYGAYQYNNLPSHEQAQVLLTLTVPLWNRNQGAIAAAQAKVGQARQTVQKVENELTGQLAESVGRYLSAQQLVNRYEKKIVPRAEETLTITQKGYAAGEFDFLRLLQAQKTLVESYLGYINAQEARWTAAAEISGVLQHEQFP